MPLQSKVPPIYRFMMSVAGEILQLFLWLLFYGKRSSLNKSLFCPLQGIGFSALTGIKRPVPQTNFRKQTES